MWGGAVAKARVVTSPVKPLNRIAPEASVVRMHTLGGGVVKTINVPSEVCFLSDERIAGWKRVNGGQKVAKINPAGQA